MKKDFPIFKNKDMHYLDTAATSQKPDVVISDLKKYYEKSNANAGRGSHELSILSKSIIEDTREKVKKFVNASSNMELVFTKNCTEAINLVAYSFGLNFLDENSEIILAVSNHHANIVPWQFVSEKTKAKLKYIYLDSEGNLDIDDYKKKLNKNTKLVAISSVVNTTGIIQDYETVIKLAHENNALVLLDVSQGITHYKQDFSKWNADFYTFSGHKMFSSFGVGALVAKKELLDKMPPFLLGGDMIEYVEEHKTTYASVPTKFEGGTMDTAAIKSLATAISYIEEISYEKINEIEKDLEKILLEELAKLKFVETYYTNNKNRVAVVAFNVKNVHSHDVSYILDQYKVFIRSGKHCTDPLHKFMNINSSCRVSFGVYNEKEDIYKLIEGLKKVGEVFSLE
ncbi:SufS family cysteine desulfurase [Oceanivirga miroungae]|uniref:cysteine desulfurase n=1 Tax=Oceanivirga miroungae TaxID=1130046 RepID=A0A6I8M702_9FUSO|nr:cysteine desulfurase [Oceanivirga miroungae]